MALTKATQVNNGTGDLVVINSIAAVYGLPVTLGSEWKEGETLHLNDWRLYQGQVWMPNADGVVCGTAPAYDRFHKTYPWLASDEVALSGFGNVEDLETDCTDALERAINHARIEWKCVVDDIHASKAVTRKMPQMNSSFQSVRLRGLNRKRCILVPKVNDVFSWSGGSGQVFGECITDISILAEEFNPFLVKGFGGLEIARCNITANIAAYLSNDIGSGTFTEFFRFNDCDIRCNKIFVFKRGKGDDSFHGCGWNDGCVINVRRDSDCMVELGDNDSGKQIRWYNGKIGGSIFHGGTNAVFVRQNTNVVTNVVSLAGDVKFELNSLLKFSDSGVVSHAGTITALGGRFTWGKALPVLKRDVMVDGSSHYTTSVQYRTLTYEKGSIPQEIPLDVNISGNGSLLMVSVTASNYEQQQLLHAVGKISGSIQPTITMLSKGRDFNTAGYGAFTAKWSNDKFVIANSGWTAANKLVVRIQVLPSTRFVSNEPAEW